MAKIVEILLVEDNPADALLTQEAFREAKVACRLQLVPDGAEAMAYLNRKEPYTSASRPDLLLLDLNLPKKDGREVLAEIKSHPDLRRIPVVVFSSSEDERDIRNSYDHYANSYVTKPGNLERYLEVIRSIQQFWLFTAKLPP